MGATLIEPMKRRLPLSFGSLSRFSSVLATLLLTFAPAASQAFWTGPPPVTYAAVKEYVNDITGHYVLLVDPVEIAGVEAGHAGPGWRYTGYNFTGFALSENAAIADGAVPVCRFYAPPPTNSHFFTANAAECEFLRKNNTGWIFEKMDFKIHVPGAAGCPAGLTPIQRQYNDRWRQNDSNHRFSLDERVKARMAEQGWVDEGIAFCAQSAGRERKAWYMITGTYEGPNAACASGNTAGSCVALHGLPDMPTFVTDTLPPRYADPNPAYTPLFRETTGWVPHLDVVFSAHHAQGPAVAAARSFVQWVPAGMPIGVHVNGTDRLAGDYASASPMYRFGDGAFYPWGDGFDRDLNLGFIMAVKTVRRLDAASHAYGAPLIEFREAVTGDRIWVTLQAYGTQGAADFVGRDVITGAAIVSTVFRGKPAFGTRLAGDFVACNADAAAGACSTAEFGEYGFRIDAQDFARVLASARTVNPRLSARIADYRVHSFQFRNETYRNARLGLELYSISLSLSY